MKEKMKKKIEAIEYFQRVGEVRLLVEVLIKLDLNIVSLDFLDFTKKYSNYNNMTLLEYCFYHRHIRILDFAHNT